MADGPSAAKKAKTKLIPDCPYGAKCYRKNPQHLKDFNHPKDSKTSQNSTSLTTTAGSSSQSQSTSLPPCKYGAKCYRKNLMHFAEYSHPTSPCKTSDDGGNDTDPVSSDDDVKKKKTKKIDTGDILKRGMSLVKSYSQMTEDERKELIKKAFEAKQKLQKELEETKDKVKEKEKELDSLQEQVSKGILLMEGEKEALDGKKIVYFPLTAERDYKEGSAAQTHFRLAESQFYRLLSGGDSYKVTKVEYVVNPTLVKNFKQAREDLKKHRGENMSYPVLAFHGTETDNIVPICETGFRVPGESGFSHRTDTGWYGKGVYFSEYPNYSMDYIQGAEQLLLCQVLPGKAFKCTKLIHGAALTKGNDSHTSPDGKELVVFNSHHILPSYIVHYTEDFDDFTYSDKKTDGNTTTASDTADKVDVHDPAALQDACQKAGKAKKSKLFQYETFQFTGTFQLTQKDMMNLITKHGGSQGTKSCFTILVATQTEYDTMTNKVMTANKKGIPIVAEKYVYDCINDKKILDKDDYFF